jgi:hypothetical protein
VRELEMIDDMAESRFSAMRIQVPEYCRDLNHHVLDNKKVGAYIAPD